MAVYDKTTSAAMGRWPEHWKRGGAVMFLLGSVAKERLHPAKTVAGGLGLTGGMVGALNPTVYDKTVSGALGSAVTPIDKTAEAGVLGLTGSMAKSMIYGETMAGDYPPLVWMDDLVKPPTLGLHGSFAKTLNSENIIPKSVSAAIGLAGGMDGSVPRTYEKAITGELGFSVPAQLNLAVGAGDGRRSLRWIRRRHRRRDAW